MSSLASEQRATCATTMTWWSISSIWLPRQWRGPDRSSPTLRGCSSPSTPARRMLHDPQSQAASGPEIAAAFRATLRPEMRPDPARDDRHEILPAYSEPARIVEAVERNWRASVGAFGLAPTTVIRDDP